MINKIILIFFVTTLFSCDSQDDFNVTKEKMSIEKHSNSRVNKKKACLDEDSDEDDGGGNPWPPEPDPNWGNRYSSRLDSHRAFRDQFLLRNKKYSKYVTYYYAFNDEVSYSDLPFNTKFKILKFVANLDSPILKILNPNFKGIVITQQVRDEILLVTHDLKRMTRNSYMFDEFEADLNALVNKTKKELMN